MRNKYPNLIKCNEYDVNVPINIQKCKNNDKCMFDIRKTHSEKNKTNICYNKNNPEKSSCNLIKKTKHIDNNKTDVAKEKCNELYSNDDSDKCYFYDNSLLYNTSSIYDEKSDKSKHTNIKYKSKN